MCVCISMCLYVCVFVCVCMCQPEHERHGWIRRNEHGVRDIGIPCIPKSNLNSYLEYLQEFLSTNYQTLASSRRCACSPCVNVSFSCMRFLLCCMLFLFRCKLFLVYPQYILSNQNIFLGLSSCLFCTLFVSLLHSHCACSPCANARVSCIPSSFRPLARSRSH